MVLFQIFQKLMDFRLIGEAGVFRRLKQGVIFRMADGVSRFHPVEGTEGLQLQAVSCYPWDG